MAGVRRSTVSRNWVRIRVLRWRASDRSESLEDFVRAELEAKGLPEGDIILIIGDLHSYA